MDKKPPWRFLLTVLVVVLAVPLLAYGYLRASLPDLDGTIETAGLDATAIIERDGHGVPTITAVNRSDLAFATGFVHAQDRFFQMDLMRRAAAGELSALFGPAALPADRERRLHRFRNVARRVLAQASEEQRRLNEKYAEGVNIGLNALGARPFEYAILRVTR